MDLALWDTNLVRAKTLKDRLDMFVPEDRETTLLPITPEPPLAPQDAYFLSFDECGDSVLRVARTVRQSSEITFILLISDRTIDLSPCFRPKIRPSGVLFRPVQNAQIRDILEEITEELDRLTNSSNDDIFLLKSDGVSHRVAFRDILFFEACNKKIILRTAGQEIGFYDSIENLAVSLPKCFIRCHRSFLVNTQKIVEMRNSDKELKLTVGIRIPFSRSCSELVKQTISELSSGIRRGA